MVAHSTSVRSLKVSPRTIAPSQLKKMVKIEYISAQVIPCTARQSFVACGMSVEAGEKYFLVQASRFPGYAYIVTWNEASAQYDCSCGNPRCTAHTAPVSVYVHAHAPIDKPATEEVARPAAEVAPVEKETPREQYARERREYEEMKRQQAEQEELQRAFATVYVDSVVAQINARMSKPMLRRGILLLPAYKEVA